MGVRGTNPSAITWGEIEKRDGGLGAPGEQLEVVSGEMAPHACSLSGAAPADCLQISAGAASIQ